MKPDKDEKCDHKWSYSGGVCRCTECGLYLQPNGDVTTTPTGRGGKVVEQLTESPTVTTGDGDDQLELVNFLPIWEKAVDRELHRHRQSVSLLTEAGGNHDDGKLKELAKRIITDDLTTDQTILDQLAETVNGSGLLQRWSKGFNSLKLKIPPKSKRKENVQVEFVLPSDSFTGDFIERFVMGRETFNGLLHRRPTIDVRLDPKLIDACSTPSEIIGTLRSIVQYYDRGLDKISREICAKISRMGTVAQRLIIEKPNLQGVVVLPLASYLALGNVKPGADAMKLTEEMRSAAGKFIDIVAGLPGLKPDQQRAAIKAIEDNVKLVAGPSLPIEILNILRSLPTGLRELCSNRLSGQIDLISRKWVAAQVESTIMTEAAGRGKVKRLKKIPADLVSYIVIEGEAIRDANDKMMIVSYAYGKLEIIEWYIELIDVQTKRYIVPHTRDYLVTVKRDIMAAIKKIMDTPVPSPNDPVVKVTYPTGYEG